MKQYEQIKVICLFSSLEIIGRNADGEKTYWVYYLCMKQPHWTGWEKGADLP